MVMPSKLWRFEWSERGAIVVSFLVKMKKVTFKLPKKFSRKLFRENEGGYFPKSALKIT